MRILKVVCQWLASGLIATVVSCVALTLVWIAYKAFQLDQSLRVNEGICLIAVAVGPALIRVIHRGIARSPGIPIASLALAAIVTIGCSSEEPTTPSANTADYGQVALEFARSLAAREYPKAYAMMSHGYRGDRTVDELRAGFEAVVPRDWGAIGPIEVGRTMTSWPGKQASDVVQRGHYRRCHVREWSSKDP